MLRFVGVGSLDPTCWFHIHSQHLVHAIFLALSNPKLLSKVGFVWFSDFVEDLSMVMKTWGIFPHKLKVFPSPFTPAPKTNPCTDPYPNTPLGKIDDGYDKLITDQGTNWLWLKASTFDKYNCCLIGNWHPVEGNSEGEISLEGWRINRFDFAHLRYCRSELKSDPWLSSSAGALPICATG